MVNGGLTVAVFAGVSGYDALQTISRRQIRHGRRLPAERQRLGGGGSGGRLSGPGADAVTTALRARLM